MRNHFFDPVFLFDFYSDIGSTATRSATWHSVHTEARRAEGRGPKGRGEILGVVNMRNRVAS